MSRLFTLAKPAKSSIIVSGISAIDGTNTTATGNGTTTNPLQINAIWPQITAGTNITITGNGQPGTPYNIATVLSLVTAGSGINVTGNGSTASPYVITNPSPATSILPGNRISITGVPPTISVTPPTTIQLWYSIYNSPGWTDNNSPDLQYSFVTLFSGSVDPLQSNRPSCVFNNLSLTSTSGATNAISFTLYYDSARTTQVNWTDAQMINFVPSSGSAMGSLTITQSSTVSQSACTLNAFYALYPIAAFLLAPPYGFVNTATTLSGFLPPGQSSGPTSNARAYFDDY